MQTDLIPHLFRTEYRKIISVLCRLFGIEHIQIAEDIVSDTFLLASDLWGLKGVPDNPTAWLYVVAKNKTKDYLKRNALFAENISKVLQADASASEVIEIDLSVNNIKDSQLAMIFVVCHPCNSPEAQIGLALNILCGFGVDEIANAFLTNKHVIYKRLQRAKEKLRMERVKIEQPTLSEIDERMDAVLMSLYLLFNEGYYSSHQVFSLRKELCSEAMRLTYLLIENERTNLPRARALLALMCFQSSRFDARLNKHGEIILYQDQDTNLWDQDLIAKGEYFLNLASTGDKISKYHLEAGIAYWHTIKNESTIKWESILQLYNQLLVIEYSPIAALNRTYVLAKANGKMEAIIEAEKINLADNPLYHSLLGELYTDVDNYKALLHLQNALALVSSSADKSLIYNKILECERKMEGSGGADGRLEGIPQVHEKWYICPMRMTISGLPHNFDKFDLQRLFNTFGWVEYTKIVIDPLTGLSRGKGIVEMKQDDQAKKAMAELNGKVLGTNPLNIKEAKERGPKNW